MEEDDKEEDKDPFQLSDIALKWMVDEIDNVELSREALDRFAWDPEVKANYLRRFQKQKHKSEMMFARMHDTMTWNGGLTGGSGKFKVILWNLMGKSVSHLANTPLTICRIPAVGH